MKWGPLRAECCSERCGRELFAGIKPVDATTIRASAASSIGRAIAAATGQTRATYTMPASVATQIVGALQRIGPKRPADEPAGEQATAPTGIDWLADLPPEIWATIVGQLDRADLRSFAATSSDAAAIARTDVVQAQRFRETRGPYSAAMSYLQLEANDEKRRILRMAYRDVAEMALGLLLTFDVELVASLSLSINEYRALITSLRMEAGFATHKALHARPIQVPLRPDALSVLVDRRFHNPRLPLPLLAATLLGWASLRADIAESPILTRLVHRVMQDLSVPDALLETHDTPCFFSYPHIFGWEISNNWNVAPIVDAMLTRGINPARPDAGFWLVDFCVRQTERVDDEVLEELIERFAAFQFGGPRLAGQMSQLMMAATTATQLETDNVFRYLMLFLVSRGQLVDELYEPAVFGDGSNNTIMFHLSDAASMGANEICMATLAAIRSGIVPAHLPPPLLVRNAHGQTPYEYALQNAADEPLAEINTTTHNIIVAFNHFGMHAHPFAQSRAHHIPILAILPIDGHMAILQALAAQIATLSWVTPDTFSYVSYVALQMRNGVYTIEKATPIIQFIIDILATAGQHHGYVGMIRALLEPMLPRDNPLRHYWMS